MLNGNLGYAETSEQQTLDAVQQKYENILTFEADFTQRAYVKMMDKTLETKGKVQIKKPGMMKWIYGLPDTQVLISNGKILWHYVSDENQVTKVPLENIYSSNTPALFLAGQEKLTQIFNIENINKVRDKVSDLNLTPKLRDSGTCKRNDKILSYEIIRKLTPLSLGKLMKIHIFGRELF